MQSLETIKNRIINKLYKKYSFLESDKERFKEIINFEPDESLLNESEKKIRRDLKQQCIKRIFQFAKEQFSKGKFKDIVTSFINNNIKSTIFDFMIIGNLCENINYIPTPEEINYLCTSLEYILKPLVEENINNIKNNSYNFVKNDQFLISLIKSYCITNNLMDYINFNILPPKKIISQLKIFGFNELEINILKYRFGIDKKDKKKYSINEISQILSISPKEVTEIGTKVIQRLRKKNCLNLLNGYIPKNSPKEKIVLDKPKVYIPEKKSIINLPKQNDEAYKTVIDKIELTDYEKRIRMKKNDSSTSITESAQNISQRSKLDQANENIIQTKEKEKTNNEEEVERMRKKIKVKTIYELCKHEKQLVDEVGEEILSSEEKNIIEIRENGGELTKQQCSKFYWAVRKMKKKLEEKSKVNNFEREENVNEIVPNDIKQNEVNDIEREEMAEEQNVNEVVPNNIEQKPIMQEEALEDQKINKNDDISKEDCIKILEIFNSEEYKKLTFTKEPLEAFIISLVCGYINGKFYSIGSIANFLQLDISKVYEIAKNGINEFKNVLNNQTDMAIKQIETEDEYPGKSIGALKGNKEIIIPVTFKKIKDVEN